MTRYTKLDGRRSIPSGHDVPSTDEPNDTHAPAEPQNTTSEESQDPKRLLKRAKLLRLKAKKTNSDETRAKHLQNAKALEQQANKLNGLRGSLGKRKKDEDAPRRNQRPRLGTCLLTNLDADQKSEFRRQMRAQERTSNMRCFVCRGTGHSAKNCPENVGTGSSSLTDVSSSKLGKDTVGICFRCGSTEHTLAKCRKPAPKDGDELPFATCYICTQKGHLASKCPQNQGRGVYPDGGSCKVCQSVEHLAKDCPLDPRRTSAAHSVEAGGVGMVSTDDIPVGADDDEFHLLARKRAQTQPKSGPAQSRKPAKKVVSF